jgi:hypothetical protein
MEQFPDRFDKGISYKPPPELAHHIGELVMAFSYSQTAVHLLVWRLLRLSFLDGRALTGRYEASRLIALLEELCERHITKPIVKPRVLAATRALRFAAEYRNMAAHGEWRTNKQGRIYCFSVQYDAGADPAEAGLYGVKPCDIPELVSAAQDCWTATRELWAIDKWLKETPPASW